MKIIIPKQNKLIVERLIDPSIIKASGIDLHLSIPSTIKELRQAWGILEDYVERTCKNPEAALQELDDIEDVIKYHFKSSEAPGYLVFTAEDNKKARVMTATEITSINKKGIGLIYQIAHDKKISKNDTDFTAATGLYKHVADLLPTISPFERDWLGIVTESRKEGPELDAIVKADFTILVPNEYYRPPATQQDKIKDPENKFTKDLVLLGKNVPEEFGEIAAKTYVEYSYCEGQNIKPTLKLINEYFKKKEIII